MELTKTALQRKDMLVAKGDCRRKIGEFITEDERSFEANEE